MGISGDDSIGKWAFHRDGIRKHLIYLEGRDDEDIPQDSLVFKHGLIGDGNDHINFHTEQDDQTVYFHGDISASGDLYIESDQYIKFGDEEGATVVGKIRENSGNMYIDSNAVLNLEADDDVVIKKSTTSITARFFGSEKTIRFGQSSTTAPTSTLEVSGSISASGGFFLENSASIGTLGTTTYMSGSQKGMFSVDYGSGQQLSGSLTETGYGYGDIVRIGAEASTHIGMVSSSFK